MNKIKEYSFGEVCNGCKAGNVLEFNDHITEECDESERNELAEDTTGEYSSAKIPEVTAKERAECGNTVSCYIPREAIQLLSFRNNLNLLRSIGVDRMNIYESSEVQNGTALVFIKRKHNVEIHLIDLCSSRINNIDLIEGEYIGRIRFNEETVLRLVFNEES